MYQWRQWVKTQRSLMMIEILRFHSMSNDVQTLEGNSLEIYLHNQPKILLLPGSELPQSHSDQSPGLQRSRPGPWSKHVIRQCGTKEILEKSEMQHEQLTKCKYATQTDSVNDILRAHSACLLKEKTSLTQTLQLLKNVPDAFINPPYRSSVHELQTNCRQTR